MQLKSFVMLCILIVALLALGGAILCAAQSNVWMAIGYWMGAALLFILDAIILTSTP